MANEMMSFTFPQIFEKMETLNLSYSDKLEKTKREMIQETKREMQETKIEIQETNKKVTYKLQEKINEISGRVRFDVHG